VLDGVRRQSTVYRSIPLGLRRPYSDEFVMCPFSFGYLLFECCNSLVALFQLSFKFCDALDIELFFFRGQLPSLNPLLWLLSGVRGPPLEKNRYFQLVLRP